MHLSVRAHLDFDRLHQRIAVIEPLDDDRADVEDRLAADGSLKKLPRPRVALGRRFGSTTLGRLGSLAERCGATLAEADDRKSGYRANRYESHKSSQRLLSITGEPVSGLMLAS